MAQLSTTTRNRLRDAYITAFPAGSILELREGSPQGVGSADSGLVLGEIILPVSPFTAGTGEVTKSGLWEDISANANGTIGHYRLTNGSDIDEGIVTVVGGGGDMEVDTLTATIGIPITIITWDIVMPGE
jgi:hypothetical protein